MIDDPIQVAWAAGLFEGEGCIFVRARTDGKQGYVRRLILTTTDLDVLKKFVAIVQCGRVYPGRNHIVNPLHKQNWQWYVGAWIDISTVLTAFMPHLGKRRMLAARKLLCHRPLPSNRFQNGNTVWKDTHQAFEKRVGQSARRAA